MQIDGAIREMIHWQEIVREIKFTLLGLLGLEAIVLFSLYTYQFWAIVLPFIIIGMFVMFTSFLVGKAIMMILDNWRQRR